MATVFPTPPTFANPIAVNPQTGENQFNPIWLNWFLVLANFLTGSTQGRIRDVVPVTGSGTYNPSNGTNNLLVALWGGGGGGGSSSTTAAGQVSVGGGGGAGGFCFGILTTGFTGVPFTIGGGGASNTAGGTTSFAGLTAHGGNPGTTGAVLSGPGFTLGGSGGTTTGGAINGQTAGGLTGIALSTTVAASGQGANSAFGCGALPRTTSGVGGNGAGYASGGAGGLSYASLAGQAGGTGGGGVGFIMELS